MFSVKVKFSDGRSMRGNGGATIPATVSALGAALASAGVGDGDVESIVIRRAEGAGFKVTKPRAKKDAASDKKSGKGK